MNIEMTDLDMILNHLETTSLEPHDNYTSEFTYKDQKILYKYIKELKQERNQFKEYTNHNYDKAKQLQQENQKLKARLELFENGVYFSRENDRLEEENDKLKEQLNELQKPQIFIDTQDMEEQYGEELYQDYLEEEVKKLKKQEFITYLKSYVELLNNKPDLIEEGQIDILKEVLTKYLEIMGVKND